MYKLALIIMLITSMLNGLHAQSDSCKISILLKWDDDKENEHSNYLNNTVLNDTFEVVLEDSGKIPLDGKYKAKIYLYDCKGKMYLKLYKNNVLISEGNYANSLDTLKEYVYDIDPFTGSCYLLVSSYFEPLKQGYWKFYDKNGRYLKKVYHKILLADSLKYKNNW